MQIGTTVHDRENKQRPVMQGKLREGFPRAGEVQQNHRMAAATSDNSSRGAGGQEWRVLLQ